MTDTPSRKLKRKGALSDIMFKNKIERARILRPHERLQLAIQLSQFCANLKRNVR